MSAMAYGGLQSILNTREHTDAASVRLTQLQKAIGFIGRDLAHLVPRGVRDEFGDIRPALQGDFSGTTPLELTRSGWHNPFNLPRSTLQRISYQIVEEKLVRSSWRILDRLQESTVDEIALLDQVSELEFRFLDHDKEWRNSWPPASPDESDILSELPLAIEISITLPDWGKITRLYPVMDITIKEAEGI
jgi:general secretion pathway protein J